MGGPPQHPRERALGRNRSFHRSFFLLHIEAKRKYNSWYKKEMLYQAQQAKAGPSPTQLPSIPPQPVRFDVLQQQVHHHLGDAPADLESKIFMDQLSKLHAQPANLDRFENTEDNVRSLKMQREKADSATSATPPGGHLPRETRAEVQRKRRAEQARKAAESLKERERRVEEALARREAENQCSEAQRAKKEMEWQRREEEERQRKVEEVRKCREGRDRELMFQALRNGQPFMPEQLKNRELVQEVMAIWQEDERRRAAAREAVRIEEMQRRFAVLERERRERARRLQEEKFAAMLAAQRQAEEAERQRLAREREERARQEREHRLQEEQAAALAAQRQAEEAERQRLAWEEEEVRRRAEEQTRRRALEEETRQADFEAQQRAKEQARRQAEHAERLRLANERARRTAQEAHANAIPGQINPFELYEARWHALRGPAMVSDIHFREFPWPVLGDVTNLNQLNAPAVDVFFTRRGTGNKTLREMLKAEILKWHPDKLGNQLRKVLPEHREAVKEGGDAIAKILNNFMEYIS